MSNDHIAIVDDDPSIRRAVARLLGAYSFHVHTYASGREFVEALKTAKPACLILDLQLNDDMSGLDVLHHLDGARLRIPTIVATGQNEPGMRRQCELAGATAYLVKPVKADVMLAAIRSAMIGKPSSSNLRFPEPAELGLVNQA